jgi:hypothetical protein
MNTYEQLNKRLDEARGAVYKAEDEARTANRNLTFATSCLVDATKALADFARSAAINAMAKDM